MEYYIDTPSLIEYIPYQLEQKGSDDMFICHYTPDIVNFDRVAENIKFCVLIKQKQAVDHLTFAGGVFDWHGYLDDNDDIKPEFKNYYSDLIYSAQVFHDYAIRGAKLECIADEGKAGAESYFSPLFNVMWETSFAMEWYLGEGVGYLPALLKMVLLRTKFNRALNLESHHFLDDEQIFDILDYHKSFDIKSDAFEFSLPEISLLALMNEKSVRNATHKTKPEVDRLITHKVKGRTYVSPPNLAAWLKKRRSFRFTE